MSEASLSNSLDPIDWEDLRRDGHRMLDDMFDHIRTLREQPLWRAPPRGELNGITEPLPRAPMELRDVHAQFVKSVLPYSSGNAHPGFMGWVQGGGTPVGMLAEMLAAGMNANLGGRDHMAIAVERQMMAWTRDLFGFPPAAGGLFVTGTSVANFMGVLAARTRKLGQPIRSRGLTAIGRHLTAYVSEAAHGCIARAMEMAGLGRDQLRLVAVDARHQIDLPALDRAIAKDSANGLEPFLLIGSAGTVDVGAIDDLTALADLAAARQLHFHIDGAFGALAMLSPTLAPRLVGIERADSLAFDWHKWGQVPYDAGYLLVRDATSLRQTFAADAAYLRRAERGLAGGDWWPCDYGPDLSRGFRALKTWVTLKTYGADAIGRVIAGTIVLAERLAERVAAESELELLGPVPLNIVCFGYVGADADRLNATIIEPRLRMWMHWSTRSSRLAVRHNSLSGRTPRGRGYLRRVIRSALISRRAPIFACLMNRSRDHPADWQR
jgi:glutamate/tyrosine decarboxylase-like PLP-dependent enzyme